MSVAAISWVLSSAPVDDPCSMMVLVALADRADSDGSASYPSVETIAQRSRSSVRTVHRRLAELERAGVIRRGDQGLVAHFRADHRPVVWDIVMGAERGDTLARGDSGGIDGVSSVQSRGDTGGRQYVPSPSYEGETSSSTSLRASCATRASRIPEDFQVTDEMASWARASITGVDIVSETEAFIDYWHGAPGQRGVKLDWVGTWRNWMRNAQKRPRFTRGKPTADETAAQGLALMREFMDEERGQIEMGSNEVER